MTRFSTFYNSFSRKDSRLYTWNGTATFLSPFSPTINSFMRILSLCSHNIRNILTVYGLKFENSLLERKPSNLKERVADILNIALRKISLSLSEKRILKFATIILLFERMRMKIDVEMNFRRRVEKYFFELT